MRALSRLLPALIFFMAGSLLVVMLGKLGTFGVVEASQRGDRVEVRLEQERASRGPAPWNQAGRSGTVPAHSLFLRFSQPMVPKERLGEIAGGLPVQMDPPVILQGWWRGYDLLEILPEAPYRRATLYRLHLDPDLVSLTGLPLARTDPLEFRSPGLRWYHLGFVDDRERPAPAVDKQDGKGADQEAGLLLDLRFDLPLRKKDLQRHLSVTDRKESPRTILGLEEVPESLGKHWVVQVPRWETSESRTQEGTRWFVVRIDKGLRPRGHALALEKPLVRSLRIGNRRSTIESGETIEDLFFRSAKAGPGRIRLDFERSIGIPLAGMVQVDPAIAFQVHGNYSGLDLVGDFPPGKTIELRLSKGFPGFGRHRLPDELVQLVRVPDLPSKIDFSSSGRILSAKARPEIEVEISNLDRAELSVRSLYPNNYMSFAHRENRDHAFGPWKTREIRLAGPRNEAWHERLDLGALLGDEVLGIHEVRIVARDPRRGHVTSWNHRILQITDLGISVRMAKGQVAVRVHGLAKGNPVADADLRILTPTNQVLSEGRTDGRGVALLTCPTGPTDSVPFVVDVRKGADRCVLDLRSFGVELYEKGQAGRAYVGDGLEAWLQTDRGIVRPGETMHLTALVRDGSGDVPLGRKLRLEWKDPRGRVLARQDLECPASGLLIADLETRPESATGTWSAWLSEGDQVIGETRFRVGAFVPERLEARVSTVGDMHQGQRAVVQIEGHWLDGAPAEASRGKLRIRFDRNRRAPDWLKGWSHTDGETPVSPGAQKPIPFVLDADGRARLAVPIPKARIGQQFLRATVLAEVQDPSGRVVRATTEAVAGPSDFVLATRLVGEKAEIALFDPEGERLDRGGKLQVSLQARRWTSSWSWYRGRWRWRSRVDRDQVRAVELDLVSGAAELDVSAYLGGRRDWIVLVAEHGGRRVELPLTPAPQNPDRLRIRTPEAGVVPGSKARIGVDAPFAGRAFVTLEGDGIHACRLVDVAKGHSEFDLEIPAGLNQPNLHIVANLTRSQAVNNGEAPYWCVGASPLRLLHEDRGTSVRILAPDRIQPDSEVEVRIRAEGATDAVIALVDEGILSVTRHPRPDPLGFFLAQRHLDGDGMDTGLSLYGKPVFAREVVEGGGAGSGARLRGTISGLIQPLALFSGHVAIDAEGRGSARFVVPAYEGRLRIVAIAAGTRSVGASAEPLIVRAPLSVRTALPRILAPGDESRLVLHVRNQTGSAGALRLELQAKGGARLLQAKDLEDRTWKLEDGAVLDLSIPFVAGETSSQQASPQGFRVHASLGDVHRYLDASCLVRPMSVYVEDRRGLAIQGTKRIKIPGTWKGGGPEIALRVSIRPDQRLLPILESLVHYPYGCLEQTLSRCWPLLSCQTLLPRLYPEGGAPRARQLVRAGIRRILSMQTSSGALGLWPGSRQARPWLTVEALDFLLAAEQMGFPIPRPARTDLLLVVEGYLASAHSTDLRVHAAEVLARAGRPVVDYLEPLGRNVESRASIARLAMIYDRIEREKEARHWLSRIDGVPLAKRQHHGAYDSPVKDLALEFRARMSIDPDADRVGELLARLCTLALDPGSLNTQEQGQVLRELAALYAFTIPEEGMPDLRVRVGEKEWVVQDEKMLKIQAKGVEEIELRSQGLCFAFVTLEGYRTDLERQEMPQLELKRKLRGIDEEEGQGQEPQVFQKGEVYEVTIEGKAGPGLRNLCLTDLLPGGFEFDVVSNLVRVEQSTAQGYRPCRIVDAQEVRDDRLLLFLSSLPEGGFRIRYPVRAIVPGLYRKGLLQVESLYDPAGVSRQCSEGRVRIED